MRPSDRDEVSTSGAGRQHRHMSISACGVASSVACCSATPKEVRYSRSGREEELRSRYRWAGQYPGDDTVFLSAPGKDSFGPKMLCASWSIRRKSMCRQRQVGMAHPSAPHRTVG